jgi:eukaryotic-like serine/threonine-protein kinase
MTKAPRCPQCGAPFSKAAEGLCIVCLLKDGLELPDAPPAEAQRLGVFEDYELLEEIARGGMGVVYKARQLSLNRIVAVKMIRATHLASEADFVRFRNEAQTVASLKHPNIVAVHEVGEHDGDPYFSMDFIEGKSLAQLVRDNPLPMRRAAIYLKIIAEAVQYAHQQGVLHRDLKPSNVLLDVSDQPRLTDFGLAKQLTSRSDLTLTGQVLGSPNFMPPEQAAGRHHEITPASDVYTLGGLLYYMVTGRPPFVAEHIPEILRLVAESEPTPPRLLVPTIPRDVETICLKCLEKEPRRRYATAQELADELGRFLRNDPISARPISASEKFYRWTRRHPVVASLTGAIGLLLIAFTVISATAAKRLQRANREGQENLREAYLSQARANRWSGRPGRRFDSLDVIRKAAQIRPGPDLRNEAIAAMALVDLREAKQWKPPPGVVQVFDAAYERFARPETNGTIVVHRVLDDAELFRVAGFGVPLQDFAFSPDGRWMAAHYRAGKTYAFKVFDLRAPGKAHIDVPDRWIRCHRFLPDRRRLAIVSVDWVKTKSTSTLILYDLESGQPLNSIPLPNLPYGLDTAPDSERIAVSSSESTRLNIYSLTTGQKLHTLLHSNGVNGLSWSSDGDRLAAACADRSVYIWNLSEQPPTATLLPHEAQAISCDFTQRGDLLVSWGWNQIAKIWNVDSGKELLRCPADGVGYFSADDRWLTVNRVPARTSISEFADGAECRPYHFKSQLGASYDIILAPDGRWMASTHRDGLRFWNLATGRETYCPQAGDVRRLQFAADGRSLITQTAGEILCWPIRFSDEGGTNRIEVGQPIPLSREKPGAVSPARRMMAIAKGKVCVFDGRTLRVERQLAAPSIYAGALSPDGRHCATWSLNALAVDLWDADDGRRITSLAVPHSPCIGFSPDGRWLITGSAEEYTFWERTTWQRRRSLPRGQTGGAHGKFAFTTDGAMVALAVGRGEVGLFNTTTFDSLATLESPEVANVAGLAFSRDGSRLAVSTVLKSIRVWDLRLVRRHLAELKLDYAHPSLAHGRPFSGPLEITVIGKPAVGSVTPLSP